MSTYCCDVFQHEIEAGSIKRIPNITQNVYELNSPNGFVLVYCPFCGRNPL